MKRVLCILFISVLFINCAKKEVHINDLQERNGLMYEVNSKEVFTGSAKSYYANGEVDLEENYTQGKLDGITKRYYEDGRVKAEANYKNGVLMAVLRNIIKVES